MAVGAYPLDKLEAKVAPRTRGAASSPLAVLGWILSPLASLKLTVALFALGIFVIFVGTLAQTEMDIWQVVDRYFRAWIMWVDVNLFFPKSFFPGFPRIELDVRRFLPARFLPDEPHIYLNSFPFPGGMIVGVMMGVNLAAAHLWRFKAQGKGWRLAAGLVIIAAGIALTTLVVLSGNLSTEDQSKPLLAPQQIWAMLLGGMWTVWVVLVGLGCFRISYLVESVGRGQGVSWLQVRLSLLGVAVWGALTLLLWGMSSGYISLQPEAFRILWQLIQGTFCGLVLLGGCWLIFQKRAGVVLLHAGIGLMMLNELVVARYAVEWQVFLKEGHTINYLRDIRVTELAIVDPSNPKTDNVVAIPRSFLTANFAANQVREKNGEPPLPIRDRPGRFELLPFDIAVINYFRNADLRALKPDEKPVATAGHGLTAATDELPPAKGTDMGGGVDMAAAYLKLTERATGKNLGVYLVSQLDSERENPEQFADSISAGGKKYELYLRFQRAYTPYTISLVDVRKDDYLGSDTPKNYSSDIRLVDADRGVDRQVHIKMNDPLRYAGSTFYQSGYHPLPDGEATTLAVVSNIGWMIPYVACMIVAVGLLAHFSQVLLRFLNRRELEEEGVVEAELAAAAIPAGARSPVIRKKRERLPPATIPAARESSRGWLVLAAALAAAMVAGLFGPALIQRPAKPGEMDFTAFGNLPIVDSGRVKPLDTLARNSLRALSNYETLKLDEKKIDERQADVERTKTEKTVEKKTAARKNLSAEQWFLETITHSDAADNYKIFHIDHPDLVKLFDIELVDKNGVAKKRPRRNLYSVNELKGKILEFEKESKAARQQSRADKSKLTPYQRKLLELEDRLSLYMTLVRSFSPPALPQLPSEQDFQKNPQAAKRQLEEFRLALGDVKAELDQIKAPRVIPLAASAEAIGDGRWQSFPSAWLLSFLKVNVGGGEADPATLAFQNILVAYRGGNAAKFNQAVAEFQAEVARLHPPDWNDDKVRLESYFNYVAPFYQDMPLYLLACVLALLGWLLESRTLNFGAFTLTLLTFLLHCCALAARIYISGRPPVTNLYSSAIFIGWGCVLLGLIIDLIYRPGLGSVVGSITGFFSLLIAHYLSAGGDTIAVLQAVLDTQIWLATHVVCITLGYTATYMSGFCGLFYVFLGICTPKLVAQKRKELARMVYGCTCFAIILSFVGTVLGGLWADDSWGRFWGWDPKENGALIIVLWNALVLHAKWDKLVGDRGLALLAVGGNIVTSWSWFGVNELGIGLHSYGFTEGVLLALGVFVLSQLAVIGVGLLPTSLWWSYAADETAVAP